MKTLNWTGELSVGVEEVDDDHRRLVGLFSLFAQAVTENADPDYQEALLDELISCTVWHFHHEERLMLEHGYAGLEVHRNEHRQLVAGAEELKEKFMEDGKHLNDEDVDYLERWVVEHIVSTDMTMGAFLAGVMGS